ncbi:MAG: hypothetical protein OXN27_23010 [Candidatus Poribacteria bacterium]|nr:hypothetical protein [Candidatus Poribacteria bacterium]
MKMSLCQMIAIVCILAVGIMTVTPFVPTANADKIHWIPSYRIHAYYCEYCAAMLYYDILAAGFRRFEHGANDGHLLLPSEYVVVVSSETVDSDECIVCAFYGSSGSW